MQLRPALVRQSMAGTTMQRFSRFKMPGMSGKPSIPGKQHAFTLIELLVTMVVVGVVLSIAMPSFKSQLSRNSADVLGQDVIFALQLARTEAIKRSAFVSLCASSDGLSCSGNEKDWTAGFIVAVDYAESEDATAPVLVNTDNPVATVLRVWEKQNANAVLEVRDSDDVTASQVPAGNARSFVRFTKLGTLTQTIKSAKGIVINMKIKTKEGTGGAENCEPRSARQYTIGPVGMVRLVNQNCW